MDASGFRRWTRLLALGLSTGAMLHAAPARAVDPLTMFLLGFAKNLIESAMEEQKPSRSSTSMLSTSIPPQRVEVSVPLPQAKPAASLDQADLRTLVDDSFAYLSRAQRAELLAGLDKALADPANAAYRETILTEFVGVARQVQFTHGRLERLSTDEKRAVAERFAVNYRALAPDQQRALIEQLRLRALPLPSDLNEMMLAALYGVP